jgi:NAD(P)-dependent dehydrogenase (short-subunit alcohol dehydrogenase family)
MPSFTIEGAVAFVTGANKANGIGRSIVEALLSAGASKIYATARYASELDDLVALHGEKTVQAVSLDVTNLDELDSVSTLYPDVTLVVNNSSYAGFTSSIQDVKKSLVEIMVRVLPESLPS